MLALGMFGFSNPGLGVRQSRRLFEVRGFGFKRFGPMGRVLEFGVGNCV